MSDRRPAIQEAADMVADMIEDIRELRREAETLARVRLALRAFFFAEVSVSSLQPMLALAEELNPGIRAELEAQRAGLAPPADDDTDGRVH